MDLFGRPYIEELRGNEALTTTLSAVTAGCGWSLVQSKLPGAGTSSEGSEFMRHHIFAAEDQTQDQAGQPAFADWAHSLSAQRE
jgi:hypothetical protein